MSGVPGNDRSCRRNRRPAACNARRSCTSGPVDARGIRLIWADTAALLGRGRDGLPVESAKLSHPLSKFIA